MSFCDCFFEFQIANIPIRMPRPSAARQALGLSPLMKANWAHASRVEGVPGNRENVLTCPLQVGFPRSLHGVVRGCGHVRFR
jgi:hypothetical protein